MKVIACLLTVCFSLFAVAGTEHEHHAVKVSPEFESMKALVGTWKGKTTMDGKEQEIQVTYELTSGGTAIIEKSNPGTPMEMITVYANRGNAINATHYCALGNQPEMTMKKAKNNSFAFEMVGNKGITNKKEMHMRGVTLTIEGNKLKQEWMNYKDNKKGDVHAFELTKAI